MRKYTIPRDEITENKGKVIMRKIKRIMATARIVEIEENLVSLLIETLGDDTDNAVT